MMFCYSNRIQTKTIIQKLWLSAIFHCPTQVNDLPASLSVTRREQNGSPQSTHMTPLIPIIANWL